MMRTYLLLILALGLAPSAWAESAKSPHSTGNSKRIVKWVDAQGVTHYGDKLPTQESGRNNVEMNTQGIVVKKNVANAPKNEQIEAEKLAQQRKDSVLLASYTKPEEIDAARDRYLQMDQAAIQSLTAQKENASGRLARHQKTASDMTARKRNPPAYLNDEIKLAKSELAGFDKQIAERKKNMDATNKRFTEEKARFIALKNPAPVPTATQQVDPQAAPASSIDAAASVAEPNKTVANNPTSSTNKTATNKK